MNYQNVVELLIKQELPLENERRERLPNSKYHSDFEFVRYGDPEGVIKHEKVISDVKKLINRYNHRGYEGGIPSDITPEFKKHVALFRTHLDFWEKFSKKKVFCKDEYYVRCLQEGHAFTEFVKKARSTCLRGLTSETDTEIEEEYFFEDYDGYNSIMHERYLIHWDDTESVDDIKYAFLPTNDVDEKKFRKHVRNLFDDFNISKLVEAPEEFDMLRELKNTKMYDATTGKTSLMRALWSEGLDTKTSYFAKRVVVPTEPGSTRDTGIGDPSTIMKVKQLNRLSRLISEVIPYCANTNAKDANSRLKRVLKRNAFLHLDFKKYGLTFPRSLTNIMIEEIGNYLQTDVSDLIIDEFTVEIDGISYRTERGTMLGWLDSVNCLAVCAILHSLIRRGIKMDFITFNDDVEISIRATNARNSLELIRTLVVGTIGSFDIPISVNKTYGSKGSVFLERYVYYDRHYELDMYKEQLTVKAYAQSCVTKYPWRAKMLFAAAEQWTKSDYARDRCIDTCPREFSQKELNAPLWSGGWFIKIKDQLDMSLVGNHYDLIELGAKLQKWRTPNYTQGDYNGPSLEKMHRSIEEKRYKSESSSEGRNEFRMEEVLEDINLENFETLYGSLSYYISLYTGSDSELPELVERILYEYRGPIDWGPT